MHILIKAYETGHKGDMSDCNKHTMSGTGAKHKRGMCVIAERSEAYCYYGGECGTMVWVERKSIALSPNQ